jgi:hypothetical protein
VRDLFSRLLLMGAVVGALGLYLLLVWFLTLLVV